MTKGQGGAARRAILAFFRALVRLFFRRVQVTGLEHVPREGFGGGIFVSWHPNGLLDPGLILTNAPRRVVFGARHGLFDAPLLGRLMRTIGTVPIYRAVDQADADPEARRAANTKSLEALAREVAGGSFTCLFPEGASHDLPHLLELRTGVARLYYQARRTAADSGAAAPPPAIVPVGLHYDAKKLFRSSVLVAFHPPLALPPELDLTPDADEDEEVGRERGRRLTAEIERALHEVVHATDDWRLHHLMHRARKLARAERAHRAGADPGPVGIDERVRGFARVWTGYAARRESDPARVTSLLEAIDEYDRDLRAIGIEDYELDRNPRLASPWLAAILLLQFVFVFLLLPPVLLVGYVINLPPAALLWWTTRARAEKEKDVASIKLLFGTLLFPGAWLVAAALAAWGHVELREIFPRLPHSPWYAAVTTFAFGAVGAVVALRYVRDARATLRSVRVRLTRRRRRESLARLRTERSRLFDVLSELAEGLDLPGAVDPEGRVGEATEGTPRANDA